jgi:hypothetical protein
MIAVLPPHVVHFGHTARTFVTTFDAVTIDQDYLLVIASCATGPDLLSDTRSRTPYLVVRHDNSTSAHLRTG